MTDSEKLDFIHMYLAHESLRLGGQLAAFRDDFKTNPLSTVTVQLIHNCEVSYNTFKKIANDISAIIND